MKISTQEEVIIDNIPFFIEFDIIPCFHTWESQIKDCLIQDFLDGWDAESQLIINLFKSLTNKS